MRKNMPAAHAGAPASGLRFDLSPRALDRWNPGIQAAASDDNTISIFDVIGQDYWTGEGVTAKRIAGALRAIGDGDVVVNINSPGGDMFEGLAIYNLLREHPGDVTVKILGVAASAASIIAMAGSEVQIARAMLHFLHEEKMLVEGAAAIGVAAVEQHRLELSGRRVAFVVSGQNLSNETFAEAYRLAGERPYAYL